jgi:signal transduction histidine kinase
MDPEEQKLHADTQQLLQHPDLMNHMARTILLLTEHSERQQRQVNDLIKLCKIQQQQIDEQKLQIILLDQFVQFLNSSIQQLNKMLDPS